METKTTPKGRAIKATRYAELVVENMKAKKPKDKKDLMLMAGYADICTRKPHEVENTIAYQERIKELIPEDTATKIHKKLLNASILVEKVFPDIPDREIRRIVTAVGGKLIKIVAVETRFKKKGVEELIEDNESEYKVNKIAYFRMNDCMVQDKALDKYYKVVSGYAPEKKEVKNFDMAELHRQIYGDNGTGN